MLTNEIVLGIVTVIFFGLSVAGIFLGIYLSFHGVQQIASKELTLKKISIRKYKIFYFFVDINKCPKKFIIII